ncbi:MAG: hypothetical protein H0U62_12545 [Actinobacteria bacterium]|nr:hypothetical protein [Actinomycetota bacterium]
MRPGPETRALADILRRKVDELHALLLQVALDTQRDVRALVRAAGERTR